MPNFQTCSKKGILGILLYGSIIILMAFCTSQGEILISGNHNWIADVGNWPSGIAWSDIDNDGWTDLACGVGIDLATTPDKIYFNSNGNLEQPAGWISEYLGYSACVQLGDLDNDGDVDMVVPGVGYINSTPPVSTVIYYNDNGFPPNPDYLTTPTINVWSLDLGDIDGDGDLDMVLPDCGITPDPRTVKIYYNNDGIFNSSPDWESDAMYRSVDAEFCDIDLDGDLDLATYGHSGLQIFYNIGGVLETTPSWTAPLIKGGFQVSFGDYDSDGYPDVAVSGGNNMGFTVLSNEGGTLNSTPVWSYDGLSTASVAWGDMDGDGDLDLVGCGWLGAIIGVFENVDGVLADHFSWTTSCNGSQLVILCDYDEDMLVENVRHFTGDGSKKLFMLPEVPIHEITSIEIDGTPIDYSQYCYHLENGWISLASAPASASDIAIYYSYSNDLDIAIGGSSVWLYENQLNTLFLPTYTIPTYEFKDENEDGFFESGETAEFYFTLNNEHITDNNVSVTMSSSNPEIVFTHPTVFFSVVPGSDGTVDNLTEPIEFIIPEMESPVYDTFYISIESDFGVYRDRFEFIHEVGRAEILIIDDDRGDNCEEAYYNDLYNLNVPSHIWSTATRGTPAAGDLSEYRITFWLTGDNTTDCLQGDDITAMQTYLDGGGNLFLSGAGISGELATEYPTFLNNYLHCNYSQDRSYYLHDGLPGTIFDGINLRLTTMQTVAGMEKITAVNGGEPILKFENTSTSYSAISYMGNYRSIFMTFGYDLIGDEFTGFSSRQELMERILGFFPNYVCGDVDGNEGISILDVVFIVNYKYKNGPAPVPENAADVDGIPPVNILDVVYLVNNIYKEGPELNCP